MQDNFFDTMEWNDIGNRIWGTNLEARFQAWLFLETFSKTSILIGQRQTMAANLTTSLFSFRQFPISVKFKFASVYRKTVNTQISCNIKHILLYLLWQICLFIFLADIVNVYLQNSLIIAKEKMITPALIINNVANMVCVQNSMEEWEKSKYFHWFLILNWGLRNCGGLLYINVFHL